MDSKISKNKHINKDIEYYIDKVKSYLDSKNIDYYDIRLEKSKKTGIIIDTEKVRTIANNQITGVGIRIYNKKKLGFCSTTDLNNYKNIIDDCIKNTTKLTKETNLKNFASNKDTVKFKHKNFDDKSLEDKVKELTILNKENIEIDYKLLKSEIIYKEEYTEKYFVNPWSYIYQDMPYTMIYSFMTGKKENIIETNLTRNCKKGGLESIEYDTKKNLLFENRNTLNELLISKPCPVIKANIILDSEVVGLFAHEAIGHPCEADAKLVNATVLDKKGIVLTNNKEINVVDDPTIQGFGSYKYDDEGIKARKTILIKNGIVNNYMTNIETATIEDESSNGSARAESFSHPPVVRMSNTFFRKGKDKQKDIFSNFSGLYLKGFAGGMVEPSIGTFMFGIKQAYKFENGKIVEKFKQASISGNILTYLKNITQVGNNQNIDGSGFCGKANQTAYVGDGGPVLKLDNVIVGGTKHE